MSLVLAVLLAALAVGWLGGGSLERLGGLDLRGVRLVVTGIVVQLAGTLVGGPAYPLGLAVSAVLAVLFLVRNRATRGTGLVGLGIAANALVVGLNGAMPVDPQAAGRAGVVLGPVYAGEDPRHEVLDARTRLRWLADVVPVPLPRVPQVVSPGDVLVAAGVGQLVVLGMRAGLGGQAPQRAGLGGEALQRAGLGGQASQRAGLVRRRPARGRPPEAGSSAQPGRDWRRTGPPPGSP